jgi:hypothetical protein
MTFPDIFQLQRFMWAQSTDFSYFSVEPDDAGPESVAFHFDTESDSDRPPSPDPLYPASEAYLKDSDEAPADSISAPPKIEFTIMLSPPRRRSKFRGRKPCQYKILPRPTSTHPIKNK